MQRHHSGSIAIDAWTQCDSFPFETDHGQAYDIPYLDVSATLDAETGRQFVSIVNTSRSEAIETDIVVGMDGPAKTYTLAHADPFAKNTFEAPETVRPVEADVICRDGKVGLVLPPHSYTILEIGA
jgi:alpha-L-arabinofuranosidase